ncbi:MAG: hypothetical protein CMH61_02780 [Nanoarchaeota archaeon]|nr:hypothetical protein [Nanoarchaeota archaeon]|tara:strand:+ start:5735 stop:6460 length:726 start_codon:yes stop_codon:yes gene_type:complete
MNVICLTHSSRLQGFVELVNNPNHTVVACIVADSDKNIADLKHFCEHNKIPFLTSEKRSELPLLQQFNYEILLTFGYPYLIKDKVIRSAKYAINCHPTLLPDYRGIYAANYAIRFDDEVQGITVHFLDPGIDTGDIILQKKVPLTLFDTPETMKKINRKIEPAAISEAIQQIDNNTVTRTKQGQPRRKTKTWLTPEDSKIPEELFSKELYNHLRSCDPERYPAFTIIKGKKVYVKAWWDNE